jgi:hypothetical protein
MPALSRGDAVFGTAEQGAGERRLAGAVGAHQGVHLADADDEREPLQDLDRGAAFDVDDDVQVIELQQRGHVLSLRRRRHSPYGRSGNPADDRTERPYGRLRCHR